MTDTTAIIEAINTHLQQLGWAAYIPAFAVLLSRFGGTGDDTILPPPDSLPDSLLAWLQSLLANPRPLRVALFKVRHWPAMHLRATNSDGKEWDYRKESFLDFSTASPPNTVWVHQTRLPPGELTRAVGFLRRLTTNPTPGTC